MKTEKVVYRFEIFFKISFLLYAMLSTCNLTYGKGIVSVIMWPMFVSGVVLFCIRGIHIKQYIGTPHLWILICLCGSYVFSSIMNYEYFSKRTIVTLIFWMFYFGILYASKEEQSHQKTVKEFELFGYIYIAYALIMVAISLGMMVIGYSSHYVDKDNGNYEICAGFYDGRLWGAFQDPNLGAVICCVAIMLSVYFICKHKGWVKKAGFVICIILFIFYIAFSDSRNGLVSLLVGITTWIFVWISQKKKDTRKLVINGCIAVLAGSICLVVPISIKKGYNYLAQIENQKKILEEKNNIQIEKKVTKSKEDTKQNNQLQEGNNEGKKETDSEQTVESKKQKSNSSLTSNRTITKQENSEQKKLAPIKRGYSMKGDISNQRFQLWASAIEVGLSRPLTGISFYGIVPYTEKNFPDTYIVNNDHWVYSTMDNELMNIFVAQGFPGLFIVIGLIISVLKNIFCNIRKVKKEEWLGMTTMLASVIVLAVSAMFQSTMFYQNAANAIIFWMFLGYLVVLLKRDPKSTGE